MGPGRITIRAAQPGNDSYNAAPAVDQSFTALSTPGPAGQVTVTTIAGSALAGNFDAANALEGRLNAPDGPSVAADSTIYFADTGNNNIRFVSPFGALGTLAGGSRVGYFNAIGTNALFSFPLGVRVLRNGNVLVADTENDVIRRINPAAAQVETFSGSGARGYINSAANLARYAFPNDLVEASDGAIYVTEFQNHTVRKVFADGSVITLAGSGAPGFANGTGTAAVFNEPAGIALAPDGNIYVTEWSGQRIRKITPAGVATTFAGTGAPGDVNGPGCHRAISESNGIVADARGNLYVTDHGNHAIRRISTNGTVSTVAGLAGLVSRTGDETTALFNSPAGIAIAPDGSLIVADAQNHRLRKIVIEQPAFPKPQLSVGLLASLEAFPVVQLHIAGQPASKVRIESSRDLRRWAGVREATLNSTGKLSLTGQTDREPNFYRVVVIP